MTSLRPNLVKRIDRLPKPTSVAAAMQPLFEAISNAIHSVQNKFGEAVTTSGRVVVTVNTNRKKEGVWATVEDNGLGSRRQELGRLHDDRHRQQVRDRR